jgi:hypothetical protein
VSKFFVSFFCFLKVCHLRTFPFSIVFVHGIKEVNLGIFDYSFIVFTVFDFVEVFSEETICGELIGGNCCFADVSFSLACATVEPWPLCFQLIL